MSKNNSPSIQYWLVDTDLIPDPSSAMTHARDELKAELHKDGTSMAALGRGDFWGSDEYWARPYQVVNRSLLVPVQGILLNKFPYQLGSWATGYEYIYEAVKRGLDDSEVDEIIFDIDSGGGLVAGCFEMCEDILALKEKSDKPIVAMVGGQGAYSAAYATACCADKIVVEKMAGTGSVGVVSMHVEFSEQLKKAGVAVTYIFAGEHKVDGNPFEKLSASVKKRWQSRVDKTYGIFVAHVAANRPLTDEEVRASEALTFDAEESIENKFADEMGRLTHHLAAKSQDTDEPEPGETQAANGDTPMAKENENSQPGDTAADNQAAIDKAASEARAEGQRAERERFSKVQASDEYQGREALATHLLASTDMDADAIVAALAASPKAVSATVETETGDEGREANADGFDKAMNTTGNPNLTEGDEASDNPDEVAQNELREAMAAVAPKSKR